MSAYQSIPFHILTAHAWRQNKKCFMDYLLTKMIHLVLPLHFCNQIASLHFAYLKIAIYRGKNSFKGDFGHLGEDENNFESALGHLG